MGQGDAGDETVSHADGLPGPSEVATDPRRLFGGLAIERQDRQGREQAPDGVTAFSLVPPR